MRTGGEHCKFIHPWERANPLKDIQLSVQSVRVVLHPHLTASKTRPPGPAGMQDKVSARLFEAEMGEQPQPHPQFFALRGLCNAMQKSSLLRLLQLHNSTFGFTSHLDGISGHSN